MQVKYTPALAMMASVFFTTQVLAQVGDAALDEIVITSSRIPLSMRTITTSVSVLSAEDIALQGNLALTDLLRQMPGIAASNNGGAGSVSSLRIRGEEAYRTLTIIDGMRVADPSSLQVSTQMEHLLSSGLGRVEVLRGPQGLAYGADAGGVINILSPVLNENFAFSADAQTGAFNTQQYSGSIGASSKTGDIYIQAVDYSTDGFNSREMDSVLADDDGYNNTTLHTRFGWNATRQLRLEVVHRNIESSSEYDGCYNALTNSTVHNCQSNYDLNATRIALNYASENSSHALSFASSKTKRADFAANLAGFTAHGELQRWEYLGNLNNLPGYKLVFGADHETASNHGESRNNSGVYGEYLSDFSNQLFFTAGLRYDNNDDFGEFTSYRVSAAYLYELSTSSSLKYRASAGSGFRAPSPYEAAYNQSAYAFLPAALVILEEEMSDGYEVAVEYYNESLHLQAIYFDQNVENSITFDLANYSGYLQDAGQSSSSGVELSGELALGQLLSFRANYTFNDTATSTGQQRARRPEQLANFGVLFSGVGQRLKLNAFYRISKDAVDDVFGSQVALEDFAVLDISGSYSFSDKFSIFGRIENLADENYQTVSGYNTAQRAAYVGMRYSL